MNCGFTHATRHQKNFICSDVIKQYKPQGNFPVFGPENQASKSGATDGEGDERTVKISGVGEIRGLRVRGASHEQQRDTIEGTPGGGVRGGGWRRRALNPEAGPSSATREITPKTSNTCAPAGGSEVYFWSFDPDACFEYPTVGLLCRVFES